MNEKQDEDLEVSFREEQILEGVAEETNLHEVTLERLDGTDQSLEVLTV